MLPVGNYNQLPQTCVSWIDFIQVARKEYEAIVSALSLSRQLNSDTPNEEFFSLSQGDEVLVCREKWNGTVLTLYCTNMGDSPSC